MGPTFKTECFFCSSKEDVKPCIVELVPGSAGVIRPICKKCREVPIEKE